MGAPEWHCTRCHDYIFISNIEKPPFACPSCGATDAWYFYPDEYPEPMHNED